MSARKDAALRRAARASAPRPAAARRAAADFQQGLGAAVRSEIRWAFTAPRSWLLGVLTNVIFALLWLAAQPLTTHGRHQDWVILVGTYFSSFVLADVTTTNVLGADHYRVVQGLSNGVAPWRILLIKNLALLVLVGVPTLVAAVALTLWFETPARLGITIPTVAVPIVSWLGVGNVISVLLPTSDVPLTRRWRQRHDRWRTGVWISSLALPYALYYVADPMGGVEHRELWRNLPLVFSHIFGPVLGRDTKSFVHLGFAFAVWIVGTVMADQWIRRRGVKFR
ncbi:hypothetical protein [Mycobacterium sp. MAA66]|uniref:hypothetical protein n=1 Tax=Mycobacterium sp. MAA66 TaxID=3156297 RepID=UPI003514C7EA